MLKWRASLVSRFKQVLISFFLLSLIALIVNGLVASDRVTVSAFTLAIDLNSLAVVFQYSVFFIFLAMGVGVLIVLILDWRIAVDAFKAFIITRDKPNDNSFRKFITIIASFAITFGVVLLVTGIGINGLPQSPISGGNEQSSGGSPPPSSSTALTLPQFPFTLSLALGIVVLATMFVGGLMAVQAMREIRNAVKAPMNDDNVLEEKAFKVVKETISTIIHEGDFRTAIIGCYERLCELLAGYNCQIRNHQTVEEFRIFASKILNIPEKPFAMLTRLFEEARYSLHEIDEAKKNDALRFLTEIRDHLSSGY